MISILLFFSLFSILVVPINNDEVVSRFFKEAPIGWKRIEEEYSNQRFRLNVSKTRRGRPDNSFDVEIVQQASNVRISSINTNEQSYWGIANDHYIAYVDMHKDGFNIRGVTARALGSEGSFSSPRFFPYHDARPGLCFDAACVLDAIVGTKEFHGIPDRKAYIVKSGSQSFDSSGQEIIELVLISAFYDAETGKFIEQSPNQHVVKNTKKLSLIPSRNWTISSFESEYEYRDSKNTDKSKAFCQLEYYDDTSHPKTKIEKEISASTNPRIEYERSSLFKCSELEPYEANKNEFYLTSFDLSEPTHLMQSHWSWKLVWISVLFAIGFITFWLWHKNGK